MMPFSYLDKSGASAYCDLDAVTDVALGYSGVRAGWTATLIYVPQQNAFVELRSSPPDVRGNSSEEAVEVGDRYVLETSRLSSIQLAAVRRNPSAWPVIDLRQQA